MFPTPAALNTVLYKHLPEAASSSNPAISKAPYIRHRVETIELKTPSLLGTAAMKHLTSGP
jgi:hypothetical protein